MATLADQIDHGCGSCFRNGSGGPPAPGWRVKAIFVPSADQTGAPSIPVDGASQFSGAVSLVKTPMNAWSSRWETNARRDPSGDQTSSEFLPRSKNSRCAPVPSSLAVQTWPSFR